MLRSLASAGPWTEIGTTAGTTYASTGLATATTYYYKVCAYNGSGVSLDSNVANATTLASPPNAPSGLTATAVSSAQINLSWTDGSTNETGFKIERSTSTSSWAQIGTTGANVLSYASTGLAASTTYSYRVRAYNTAGDSGYSNTASATTAAATGSRWSRRHGDTVDDRGQAVTVDGLGNVVLVGHLDGATDLGSGTVSSYVHPSMGPTVDIVIAEYSSSGAHLWSRVIGSDGSEEAKGVTTDSSGNVIATGYQGSYGVDYGGGIQYLRSGYDVFVAKYSSAGSWIWSKTVGGGGYDGGNAVTSDGAGNVLVTGYFGWSTQAADFGGGGFLSAGQNDAFVVKYSATGAHVWSKRLGGTANDAGTAIAADSSGNVFVAGTFEGTVDFGGGPLSSAGLRDLFLVKYNPLGQFVWAKRFGSTGDELGNGLAIDSASDLLLSGKFQGSVGFGGPLLTSAGGDDVYVAKLDGVTGDHVWSKRFGNTGSDISTGVAVDGSDNVVLAGYYAGSVDFGGGALSSLGVDVFVARYSPAGAHLSSRRFGGADTQICDGVAAAANGDITVTGFFNGTIDFGTGAMTSAGAFDGFTASIAP